ncbi:hypothetical protein MANES_12G036450v8 [Manihot esculenta]|uniref:Uncharacterized protein n=1 Tax=Manihot esculenta TaxID=3983 RepID=A0ACB7GNQ2_MANES|nr:hypothetical protein MANES_12G036450v8 [Manihot esculenta]
MALSLISSPSSPPSINLSMALFTSFLFTSTPILSSSPPPPHGTGTSVPALTPIFNTSTTSLSFKNWSPKSGHVTIGLPAHIPSSIQFHTQCVKNPPTAACDNIATWGAQPRIKKPLSLILSSKPSSSIHFSIWVDFPPPLSTQMKGLFDASNAKPSSINCEVIRLQRLPKQTYNTESGF